ncbi:MAG TPA: trypsin-like peptidase domain-containing protein, partial [Pilimelia sp.]|nr:trypsin-like peptidase domain-containing protein [Pilimelia sp.]
MSRRLWIPILALAAGVLPVLSGTALALTAPGGAPPAAPAPAPALDPRVTRVGEERASGAELRYASTGRLSRTTVHAPGATYVKVHFSSFRVLPGDYVTVADPSGREVHTYRGDPTRGGNVGGSDHTVHGPTGFAALSIDGDTAIVTLHSAAPRRDAAALGRQGYGVRIDRHFRGFTRAEVAAQNPSTLSVCGTDARRDVVCYQSNHPTEYAKSRAVARQLLRGTGHCTAWRVGNTNRMLSNAHCIESAADLAASEFQFDYECATCGGNNPRAGTKVSGAELIKMSGLNSLDYTLFSVNNFAAIQQYGTLYLDNRAPVQNETIYIPGHGDTRPKRLSLYEESDGGARCKIDVVSSGVNTGYRCDTSGGNSGSPVLAASSHKVIALHHLGGCPNWGTRITLVYAEIAGLIDNNDGGGPAPSPTPTRSPSP